MSTLAEMEAFYGICEEQGVELHPELTGFNEKNIDSAFGMPSQLTGVIRSAADILRSPKGGDLANGTIEITDEMELGFAASTLARIINGSQEPETPPPGALSIDAMPTNSGSLTCAESEPRFMRTAEAAKYASESGRVDHGFQLFESDNGPALVRKSLVTKNALSLQDLYLNGIFFPAGSLMALQMGEDTDKDRRKYMPPEREAQIRSTDDITGLSFLRLSAFAFDVEERRWEGFRPASHGIHDTETAELFYKITPEDIADALAFAAGRAKQANTRRRMLWPFSSLAENPA